MASVKPETSIKQFQGFVYQVYGLPNDRSFNLWDMLTNMERFVMRGIKGIRKEDPAKSRLNLSIALSWLMSIMNQLHLDLEQIVWERFPYRCHYCLSCPCACKDKKVAKRKTAKISRRAPKTLRQYQQMFNAIYPADKRSLNHAAVHLAEEVGEFSEAILTYRGGHRSEDFKKIELEAADLFSCLMAVFNSLKIDAAQTLSVMFKNNCHVCHRLPCVCDFKSTINFKS